MKGFRIDVLYAPSCVPVTRLTSQVQCSITERLMFTILEWPADDELSVPAAADEQVVERHRRPRWHAPGVKA